MEEEDKEQVEESQYKPYEVKLPPIGARPGMASGQDNSEEVARKLQAKFDAEAEESSSLEESSEDEAEMAARYQRRNRSKKARRRQKRRQDSFGGVDFGMRDNEDIALQP